MLGWTNDMGYADAGRVVGWMSNFVVGLFTSGNQGFDPLKGAAYRLPVYDPESGRRLASWADLFSKSELPDKPQKEVDEAWTDYGMVMRAAVGAAYSVTGSPQAERAYMFISKRLETIDDSYARGDPTFAIVPSRPAADADR